MERKIGKFYSLNKRGFALICVTPRERYFMHFSEYDSDQFPVVGERVSFEPRPPLHPERGQLPLAVLAKPVAPEFDPAELLSGKAVL
jgi:hypothetical protein